MYSQCQTAAPFSRTPLKSTDTDALWHLVWIMCAHTLLSNCVCVCGSVCCLFSVSEMSSHAGLLDKACYGALRGTSRARGENIWKGTFLRGDHRAAHSQTGWRSLYPPSYFLFQSFLTPTCFFFFKKRGITGGIAGLFIPFLSLASRGWSHSVISVLVCVQKYATWSRWSNAVEKAWLSQGSSVQIPVWPKTFLCRVGMFRSTGELPLGVSVCASGG